MKPPVLSIIIPASNEEARIASCLEALSAQTDVAAETGIEIIVVANGCSDATADVARAAAPVLECRGWTLCVLELKAGSKIAALNAGDRRASAEGRLYLDADIVCAPDLLAKLLAVLSQPVPVYAGARLVVAPSRSWISRHYARFWQSLPFHTRGVTGAGLFAVNGPGRRRWAAFPQIIADDAFVRSLFTTAERVRVEADYHWPLSEGFRDLVRVRRRQDAGVRELAGLRGGTDASSDRPERSELLNLALADPVGFGVYVAVAVATRLRRTGDQWARRRS